MWGAMRLTLACYLVTFGLRLLPKRNRKGFWRTVRCYCEGTLQWEKDG